MRTRRLKVSALSVTLALAVAGATHPAVAQQAEPTEGPTEVLGAVSLTNNGISFIPTFSLGRPAAAFDLAIRRGHLGFEPQFKLGLDGEPWVAVFWWRYRVSSGGKLQLTVGGHQAVAFRTIDASAGGDPREIIEARRYLAGEVSPTYAIAKYLSVGVYYMYGYGIEQDAVRDTHFLAARGTLTGAEFAGGCSLQFAPQLYYLKMDDQEGWYVSAGVTLSRRDLPVSLSAMVNDPIRTTLTGGRDFVWNVSATYAIK